MLINTENEKNDFKKANNNAGLFLGIKTLNITNNQSEKSIKYLINLDAVEVLVKGIDDIRLIRNDKIKFRLQGRSTKQFRDVYKINFEGIDLGEIRVKPHRLGKFESDQGILKVANHLLYTTEGHLLIQHFLDECDLEYCRVVQLHIAVDSIFNKKSHSLLQQYFKSHRVQLGDDRLNINPVKFDKKQHLHNGFNIGKSSSCKTATIYNKSVELKKSHKGYIEDFWKLNGLRNDQDVYRFELKLKKKSFKVDMPSSITEIFNTNWYYSLFQLEVENWLKIYTVKARDIKAMKKENALKKSGKLQQLFRWNDFRIGEIKLDNIPKSPSQIITAKRSIVFALDQTNSFQLQMASRSYAEALEKEYGLDGYIPFDIKIRPIIDWHAADNFLLSG